MCPFDPDRIYQPLARPVQTYATVTTIATTCVHCHREIIWGSLATRAEMLANVCPVPCEPMVLAPEEPAKPLDVAQLLALAEDVGVVDIWHSLTGVPSIQCATEADALMLYRVAKRHGYRAVRTSETVTVTLGPTEKRNAAP